MGIVARCYMFVTAARPGGLGPLYQYGAPSEGRQPDAKDDRRADLLDHPTAHLQAAEPKHRPRLPAPWASWLADHSTPARPTLGERVYRGTGRRYAWYLDADRLHRLASRVAAWARRPIR